MKTYLYIINQLFNHQVFDQIWLTATKQQILSFEGFSFMLLYKYIVMLLFDVLMYWLMYWSLRVVGYAAPAVCQLSICALMNLGQDLQSGGDERAGRTSSDPFGHGKWCQRTCSFLTDQWEAGVQSVFI